MIRKRTQAREYALQVLYQMEMNPEGTDSALPLFWKENPGADEETRMFTERIVQGVLKNMEALDQKLKLYTDNWRIQRLAAIDRNILRFGAFEILYMEDVPPKVTINECVNIAKKYSQIDSGKFVNGVLDKIAHSEATF